MTGLTQEDLDRLGVQGPPASKRRHATTRVYDAPLDEAMLARVRAKVAAKRGAVKP